MKQHDIVVIGSGHNGLIAGAYLAIAGLDVLVLEKEKWIGGGTVTAEVTLPGFKHDLASTTHGIAVTPIIVHDELKLLSKYGLEYIRTDPDLGMISYDGHFFALYKDIDKTCEQIAKFSPPDAENYRRYIEWSKPIAEFLLFGFSAPPGARFHQFMDALAQDPGVGSELVRVLNMSSYQFVSEWFEHDIVKTGLIKLCCEGCQHPFNAGTAMVLPLYAGISTLYGGGAHPKGGSGELAKALVRCIQDNGGEVRANSPVAKVNVSGEKATGVILESGEEIGARRAVVSNVNIKQLFPGMIKGYTLDPNVERKIQRILPSSYGVLAAHLALNEAPNWKASKEANKAGMLYAIPPSLKEYLDFHTALLFGEFNGRTPGVSPYSVYDPSRAPKGKHSLYMWQFVPMQPRVKGKLVDWDEVKDQVYEENMEILREHCTNMGSENILAHVVHSPKDIARMNSSMIMGDVLHIGTNVFQIMSNRPIPEMGMTRTMIERLYLASASSYPFGGTVGGGRGTAMIMMEDFGIDFDKIFG